MSAWMNVCGGKIRELNIIWEQAVKALNDWKRYLEDMSVLEGKFLVNLLAISRVSLPKKADSGYLLYIESIIEKLLASESILLH